MPHDAIDTGTKVPITTSVKSSPWWVPEYVDNSVGNELGSMIWRQEPPSTSNPLRGNGTRAPSAYWANSIVIVNSFRGCASGISTVTDWFCRSGDPHPCLARFGTNPDPADVINWFVEPVGFNVENRAKTKFLTNLMSEKGASRVDLGVAAGEFRETVHMGTDLAFGLKRGITSLARKIERSPQSVDRFLRRASKIGVENALVEVGKKWGSSESRLFERIVDGWLTVQLGLKPLAHDIYDASVYLQSAVPTDGSSMINITVRGGASEEYSYSKVLCEQGLNGSWVQLEVDLIQSVKIDYSCVYKVPIVPTIAQQLGFDNPAYVAWNLVRYTWLFDYAVGVGDWLASFTAANDTKFLEGTMSRKRVTRLDKLRSVDVLDSGLTKDPAKGPLLVNISLFERELLGGVGVTPAAMPGVKSKLGLNQLANAVAVLKNFVR